ncbi:MAG: hypothetical protein JNN08_07480 [Bryobacterales bacterium]|nr:hypothetical protein [Bryobacterales bacterium]
MGLDIRKPIGLLLLLIGVQLTIYGVLSSPEEYRRALGLNVDLYWGVVLIAFGSLFLISGYRGQKRSR